MFVKLLTFEEQFKLKYGRSVGRPASVSALPVTQTFQAITPTKETREVDNVTTTISSGLKSAFKEHTRSVLQQLDEQRSSARTQPHN